MNPSVPPTPTRSALRSTLGRWLPLLGLAGIALIVVATGAHRWLSLEAVALHKGRLEAFVDGHVLLALAAFMTTYVAITALSIPGALVMTIIGGLLFPFWIAVLAVLISATVGATLLFLVASSSVGETLRRKGGPAVVRMTEGLRADAASYMLFLRLVPVFPFALVNIAPAIVGVPLRTFIWTTFVGILPGTLAFILATNSLDSVLDERKVAFDACRAAAMADCRIGIDLTMLVSPKLLIAFAALGVIALIPVIAKRLFARRKGTTIA